MALTKAKGNMYGFISHVWNPLGGACYHDCKYCSSNKFRKYEAFDRKYSGHPRLIDREFRNFGKDKVIFVCAQNDLFAPTVPGEYVDRILEHCFSKNPDNVYFFQTKNPKGFYEIKFRPRGPSVICVTIETNRHYPEIMHHAPEPYDRFAFFYSFMDSIYMEADVKWHVTIEPIMDFDIDEFGEWLYLLDPDQINIGADSGGNNLPEPSRGKVDSLIGDLQNAGIRVWKKKNLKRLG